LAPAAPWEDGPGIPCTDMTSAHLLERPELKVPPGDAPAARGRPEPPPTDLPAPSRPVRVIAFYLPQFHPIPENDRWWGRGFTEWTNVTRAEPMFPGHSQPRLPADLGFYDLRVPETRKAQAALAASHGIAGFCYHHYWFGGRRLLERPFQEVLASGSPDFPFCVCWANENWSRRWDGSDRELLIAQNHSPEDDRAFLRDLLPALHDRRYIRVDGRPLLLVYRSRTLPDPVKTAEIWRREAESGGLPGLYLCRAETFEHHLRQPDPRSLGFDAAVEFPPHGSGAPDLPGAAVGARPDFAGNIFDYLDTAERLMNRPDPAYTLFRGVMPTWDNTARRLTRADIWVGSTPAHYRRWMIRATVWTLRRHRAGARLVFVNSWNEWAEGAHLEPDTLHGAAYLEATRQALDWVSAALGRRNGAAAGEAPLEAAVADALLAEADAAFPLPGPPAVTAPPGARLARWLARRVTPPGWLRNGLSRLWRKLRNGTGNGR
jgi:lipopolysaccharide biosynthesis protein